MLMQISLRLARRNTPARLALVLALAAPAASTVASEPTPAAAPSRAAATTADERAGEDDASASAAPLAIVGATVLTMVEDSPAPDEGTQPLAAGLVLERATIVIEGGTITAVGPTAEIALPAGARVVDGSERWVLPGLVDLHVHLPIPDDLVPGALTLDATLALCVAHGITTLRSMHGDPSHVALRDAIRGGERLGPGLVVASPPLYGDLTPEQVTALVAEHARQGYDLVKLHEGLAPAAFDAAVRACREHGLPFAGHVTDTIAPGHALAAGPATLEHLDNFLLQTTAEVDERPALGSAPHVLVASARLERLPALARATSASGCAIVPTLALFEAFASGRSGDELDARIPELEWVPAPRRAFWSRSADNRAEYFAGDALGERWLAARRAVVASLLDANVPIVCGTDSPRELNVPGFALARELEALVCAGLDPQAALAAATRTAADALGRGANEGRIAPGYRADLVVLMADPLADVAHVGAVESVVLNGKLLDRPALDALLDQARPPAAGPEQE